MCSGPRAEILSQFPGVDETGAIAGFNANEALVSTATPITDYDHDSEYLDDEDPPDALSSQLTSLSQRARQAMRRLVRPGRMPLTVSSPEVKEALEDTNTLIRIMKYITTPDRDEKTLDPTITDCGLAFSALACHQHLVALFRAICDAIHRCLQSKDETQQQDHLSRQQGDVGPFSVAQFVMVLQLLMHLINRMDRSLLQNNPSICQGAPLFASGYITPVTPNGPNRNSMDVLQPEAAVGGSSPGGLLVLVRDIVGTIPNEHEKLRQVIQTLQTEMEHSELH
ncbi:fungal zn(2)-Cys(6) binuclear cluster domain-containing protein [Penicillium verhagenii]|nr:fungal zn(2)-Cys(6) binuclear cluster domain-containing protein [Penicillium verhagenii]